MSPATAVRHATPSDLPDLRRMFSAHHGREWTEVATERALGGFDPGRGRVWVATVDDRVVGMTAMEFRTLDLDGRDYRAGYWTNLFIDPAHRQHMFYPRPPLAMFAAARELRLDLLYGCIRRLQLMDAHRRLGFTTLGTIPLRFDPVRPARLVAKRFEQHAFSGVSALPDAGWTAWHSMTRRSAPPSVREEAWSADAARHFRELQVLAPDPRRCRLSRTPQELYERFRETPEHTDYRVTWVQHGDAETAAVLWRVAERAAAIRMIVLMEIVCRTGDEGRLPLAMNAIWRRALELGCELVLTLDGWGPGISAALDQSGYWSARERYELMVWPPRWAESHPDLATSAAWRFGFGDHDAF